MADLLKLDALTLEDCEEARRWRNTDDVRKGFRTPYVLTEDMQKRFYEQVVSDPTAPHRFWAVRGKLRGDDLRAVTGLTYIEWENGLAEISLLVNPATQGKGVGSEVVRLVLREAFERLRLLTVTGEVYMHNPAVDFWRIQLLRWPDAGSVVVPRRKWWDGQLHDSLWFWFAAPSPLLKKREAWPELNGHDVVTDRDPDLLVGAA